MRAGPELLLRPQSSPFRALFGPVRAPSAAKPSTDTKYEWHMPALFGWFPYVSEAHEMPAGAGRRRVCRRRTAVPSHKAVPNHKW
jgi:hypothetical protein